MQNELYGRRPLAKSRNPFTCGLTGKTFSVTESHKRTDYIARALGKIMGWEPNADLPWDKVVAVFSFNTVSLGTTKMARIVELTPFLSRRSTTSPSYTPFIVSTVSQPQPMSSTQPASWSTSSGPPGPRPSSLVCLCWRLPSRPPQLLAFPTTRSS